MQNPANWRDFGLDKIIKSEPPAHWFEPAGLTRERLESREDEGAVLPSKYRRLDSECYHPTIFRNPGCEN